MDVKMRWMALSILLFVFPSGCDTVDGDDPEPGDCSQAMEHVATACCPGGPDHGAGDGLGQGSVTYTDCLTNEQVTVPCADGTGIPADETVEGDQQDAGQMDAACQQAIEDAQTACPGYDPESEADAVTCPGETDYQVLPSCDQLEKLAAAVQDCSPLDLREWDPIPQDQVDDLKEALGTQPDEIGFDDPPPASSHDDGTPTPDPASGLENPNQLLSSLRLEIPGNFLRYQLRHGPLRAGFEKAASIEGFTCYPDELRCQINPLALYDLTDMFPKDGAFKVDVNPVQIDGQKAWRLENIRFEPDMDGYPGFSVTWGGHVDVSMNEPIEVDLGPPARFSLLPLHMPNDGQGPEGSNSYPLEGIAFPDRQRNMLDQALLITHLDPTTCWSFKLNPAYLTYALPMRCNCPSNAGEFGYCVTELSPREEPHPEILAYAVETEHSFLALCTDPLLVKPVPYKYLFQAAQEGSDPDLGNMKVTATFDNFMAGQGAEEFTVDPAQARQDLVEFGCSDRLSLYARVGDQVEEDFGGIQVTAGEGATSAAGIELVTSVGMGGLKIQISPGRAEFAFDVGARFEEWAKKKFGSVFGWFLKWVLKILSGWVNLQIGVDLPPVGAPNTAYLSLDPTTVKLHGLISQVQQPGAQARDGFAVGMRRVTTNKPGFGEDDWELRVEWDTPNCDDVTSSNTTLLEKYEALIKCPMDIVYNLAGMALQPLTTFLAKQLLESVFDLSGKLNATLLETIVSQVKAMEEGNIIARLIKDAGTHFLFEPYYLAELGDPAKASVGRLPPYLATACAAAPDPELACTLMHLLAGNGLVSASYRLELLRVGAKTHYRSMEAFDGIEPSYCFPPVRYCVVGDDPPGAGSFTTEDRSVSQDFDEVDVVEQNGMDWRKQCALFADFSARALGSVQTPSGGYEIGVWPSLRTQILLNEIFVCRNAAHCHPAAEPNHLAARAELAACSLLGDIWGRRVNSADPYANELYLLTTVTDPDGLAALQEVWDAYLQNIELDEEANSFATLIDFAASCQDKLNGAGFPSPPQTLPADAFQQDAPYSCAPRFLP